MSKLKLNQSYMQLNTLPEYFFKIFDEIETATNQDELNSITRMINNRTQFFTELAQIKQALDSEIEKKNKELVNLTDTNINLTSVAAKKLTDHIATLIQDRQRLFEKIPFYENLIQDFVKPIENANSPQEIDIYISYIEDEENIVFGNLQSAGNPVHLRKLLRFLNQKYIEAQEKKTNSKSLVGNITAASIGISRRQYIPIRSLAAWLPDSLEDWAHKNISLEQLQEAITACKLKIKEATDLAILSKPDSEKNLFLHRIQSFDALIEYAETAKLNFNKRQYIASWFHLNATIFSLFSALGAGLSAVAKFFSLIPGVNLIAEGLRKASEAVSFSSLTAAYALDPTVPKSQQLAALRHYEALKKYQLAEVSTGAIGTLTLAIGLLLPVIPIAAASIAALPLLAPILLVIGTGVMAFSNFVSFLNSYQQLQHAQQLLEGHPLLADLNSIKERNAKGEKMTTEENRLLRAELSIQMLNAQTWSGLATTIGAILLTIAATAFFATALAFPPVAMVLAAATALFSVFSLYKKHKEKIMAKKIFKVNNNLDNDQIIGALHTIKQRISSDIKLTRDRNLKAATDTPNSEAVKTTHTSFKKLKKKLSKKIIPEYTRKLSEQDSRQKLVTSEHNPLETPSANRPKKPTTKPNPLDTQT